MKKKPFGMGNSRPIKSREFIKDEDSKPFYKPNNKQINPVNPMNFQRNMQKPQHNTTQVRNNAPTNSNNMNQKFQKNLHQHLKKTINNNHQ